MIKVSLKVTKKVISFSEKFMKKSIKNVETKPKYVIPKTIFIFFISNNLFKFSVLFTSFFLYIRNFNNNLTKYL